MVLFHFVNSSIFLTKRHPCLFFPVVSAGGACNPSYPLIHFVWPLSSFLLLALTVTYL